MKERELKDLIDRYLSGQCSQEEANLVDSLFEDSDTGLEPLVDPEVVRTKMLLKVKSGIRKETKSATPTIYRIAASVILVACIGIVIYLLQDPVIEKEYLSKSTGDGQKANITLSDGTSVHLNAKSVLRYPKVFAEDQRAIELEGEAYFEVVRDEQRPFVIKSHQIQTTVLGTSFNVNAYDSTLVSVALVDGSVEVSSLADLSSNSQSKVLLNPGELASYDAASGDLRVSSFDEKKMIAWKDGVIYLSGADHNKVFDQLAHWYGVEFEFANAPTEKWEVSGEFKDMSLELVLKTIGQTKGFDFQIKGKEIYVEFIN